jgi:hypothetical protein
MNWNAPAAAAGPAKIGERLGGRRSGTVQHTVELYGSSAGKALIFQGFSDFCSHNVRIFMN